MYFAARRERRSWASGRMEKFLYHYWERLLRLDSWRGALVVLVALAPFSCAGSRLLAAPPVGDPTTITFTLVGGPYAGTVSGDWDDGAVAWVFDTTEGQTLPSGWYGYLTDDGTLQATDFASGDSTEFPGAFSGSGWVPTGGPDTSGTSWDGASVTVPEGTVGAAAALFFPLVMGCCRRRPRTC